MQKEPLPPNAISLKLGEVKRDGKEVPAILAEYPPMSADLIRWMYCRQNPAVNINFGPGPAIEVRSRFIMKLWNTYSFFCEYARLDAFDPSAAQVLVRQRPDLDRWILSELQLLVGKGREAFDGYNLMGFCLEAERFVDDKLSNWYIRRNRRRFWKSEVGEDKQAAYQTLYTVLLTLTKLFAPIVPFLTETMYQNLAVGSDRKASVHHCTYPVVDETLIDKQLSEDMDALLALVSLGSAARNTVKLKVRQPLAEIRVLPGNPPARNAVERFADQVAEELNLKKVTLHEPSAGPLLSLEIKMNDKLAGPKFGPRLKDVKAALAAANPDTLAGQMQKGAFTLETASGPVELDAADVVLTWKAPEGWAGSADGATQVIVDTRITEELAREGMARDVVRQVQDLRKKADLDMEDRIVLYLSTNSENLQQAIQVHQGYIAAETLTVQWAETSLNGQGAQATVKVDNQPLTIELWRQTV